jgi:anti-anti-sigma factor
LLDVGDPCSRRSAAPQPGSTGTTERGRRRTVSVVPATTVTSDPLPPEPASAAAARQFVRQHGTADEDVALMVSELASNAVLHARTAFTVGVSRDERRLRVEVHDDGEGTPAIRPDEGLTPSGRGLRIVQLLSERWGTEAAETGKVVWFEVELATNGGLADPPEVGVAGGEVGDLGLPLPRGWTAARDGDEVVLVGTGDLDLQLAPAAQEALLAALAEDVDVRLDLREVGFVDSVGLSSVITAHLRFEQAGRRLRVVPSPTVERLLEMSMLLEHLHVVT